MPTVAVAIGDEPTVELPAEWTPVIQGRYDQVDPWLVAAWAARTAPVTEMTDARVAWEVANRWWVLLFELWQKDVIELADRALKTGARSCI